MDINSLCYDLSRTINLVFKKITLVVLCKIYYQDQIKKLLLKKLFVVVQVIHLCIHHYSQYIFTKSHHLGLQHYSRHVYYLKGPPHSKSYLFSI